MTELVVFPDAEQIYVEALRAGLATFTDDAEVHVRLPDSPPTRVVQVARVGGVRDTQVTDSPRLSVRCWGSSDTDAHDLAQRCRAVSFSLHGDADAAVQVYRVDEVGGPVPVYDTDRQRHSYMFTHQLRLRGAVQ